MCDCPQCLLYIPVLTELQQAILITSEDCNGLYDPSDVIRLQSGKSPEVQSKTADVLKRHGFENESNLIAGKQTQPLIHVNAPTKTFPWVVVCQQWKEGGTGMICVIMVKACKACVSSLLSDVS